MPARGAHGPSVQACLPPCFRFHPIKPEHTCALKAASPPHLTASMPKPSLCTPSAWLSPLMAAPDGSRLKVQKLNQKCLAGTACRARRLNANVAPPSRLTGHKTSPLEHTTVAVRLKASCCLTCSQCHAHNARVHQARRMQAPQAAH